VFVDGERVRPEGSEVEVLLSNPKIAKEQLGWSPNVDLEDGLRAVAAWIADRQPNTDDAARYVR
jgi:UDP-glucose 4-epimerase